MNKKGEINIGVFVIGLIAVVVTIALFTGTFDPIGKMTNIYTLDDDIVTTAATGNATITLTGRENTTAVVVINTTDGADWSSNFTITTTNAGGNLAILLVTTDAAVTAGQNGTSANVSYSYKPDGYNDGSGARGIIVLVFIFGALSIAFSVFPDLKDIMKS